MKSLRFICAFMVLVTLHCQNSTSNTTAPNSTVPTAQNSALAPLPSPNSTVPTAQNSALAPLPSGTPFDSNVMPPFTYPMPGSFVDSTDLNNQISNAFTPIFNDFSNYYSDPCQDSRVPDLFGLKPGDDGYNDACISLVYDWAQAYTNYTCNNWFCNNQGSCSFSTDDFGFVNPNCTCNAGFNGQNCMFTTQDYSYAKAWLDSFNNWVSQKVSAGPINDTQTVMDLISILGQSTIFTTNVNVQDLNYFGNQMANVFNAIVYAKINFNDPDVSQDILDFVSSVLSVADSSLNGVDPTAALSLTNVTSQNTSTYGYYSQTVDPTVALVISPSSTSSRLRFLYERFLATATATAPKKNSTAVNMASSRLVIPQNATAVIPSNIQVSFSFVRDPKPYNQINGVAVQSQVVTVSSADANKKAFNYPSNVANMTMTVPWANAPMNNANFVANCIVYSYNKVNWNATSNCIMTANTTNAAASISCNNFGTYGVACTHSQVVIPKKSNGSSWVQTSSLVLALIALILF